MDAVVKVLMERYHMTREQAEVFAQHVRNSNLPPENRIKVEALQATITPYVERAKRIAYFNELNGRYMAGETLTMEELQYLDRVKEAEAKRMRERAAAMLTAKKLGSLVGPAATAMVDRAAPLDLNIGPARITQETLPIAPRSPAIPDPTRYALMSPVQAFTESFRDHSAPPADIDPVSGSPMDSIDYHAFREARQPQLDLEIGPVTIQREPDPADRLRMLEEAAQRRQQHAEYWNRPENRARRKQLDEELLAERKKLKK